MTTFSENNTMEIIHQRMIDRVDSRLDKRQGSIVWDMTSPAAAELSMAYVSLDIILDMMFADTAEGEWLDKRGSEVGVDRKTEMPSKGVLTISGPVGQDIPQGTRIHTKSSDPIYVTTDVAVVVPSTGVVKVPATSEEKGFYTRAARGTLTEVVGGLSGIITVTNDEDFSGGLDRETDADYRRRYSEEVRKPSTSGNPNHYLKWAKEVNGIADAKVYPVWNGPLTVKVVLLGSGRKSPPPDIIENARTYIESQMPIGAKLTVEGATEVPISVSFRPLGGDPEVVRAEVTAKLDEYLGQLAFVDPVVRYNHIAGILLLTPTLVDYADLTVNGGMTNITIPDGAIAVPGVVTLL